ncbi:MULTISPECIES: hypothetical protein [unclassified Nostoc]|nr:MULTISPECIES: hypothetical protein [unclassified Nostoc]MDM9582192.1 hypothetical protein [Nostoc sp. GT001]MDZ7947300.1 hypothetical protein [Nostoc sp. EfeVER01]MDZ7995623.1 hypothetical protein [Nostoc sp. EspVER01]
MSHFNVILASLRDGARSLEFKIQKGIQAPKFMRRSGGRKKTKNNP